VTDGFLLAAAAAAVVVVVVCFKDDYESGTELLRHRYGWIGAI